MATHCKAYIIPEDIITQDEFYMDTKITQDISDRALDYLSEQGIVLEFGDLVVLEADYTELYNDGICIYDGQKVIPLSVNLDNYGNLPKRFRILEESIATDEERRIFPIRYWHRHKFTDDWIGIGHNSHVWFDHTPYLDQILANIRYDRELFKDKYALYTSFTFQNTTYYIVMESGGTFYWQWDRETYLLVPEDQEKVMKRFIEMLKMQEAPFQCMSEDYEVERDAPILFLEY